MIYYKIEAKEIESSKQIIRTLKNSRTWVRSNGNPLELYSATGNDHTSHVIGIANQFNARVKEIAKEEIPESVIKQGGIPKREYIAFDNTVFTDKNLFAQYERNNNPEKVKAREKSIANLKPRKPRANKTETIYRIEPNQDFTMQGVINSLEILEDKLLKAYNDVSDLGVKLAKISEYDKLLQDRNDYLNAARIILKEKTEFPLF